MDKAFCTAIAVSAAIHSLIFLGVSPRLLLLKKENIRVTYMKNSLTAPARRKGGGKKELIEIKDRRYNAQKLIEAARVDKAEFIRRQPSVLPNTPDFTPKPLSTKESFPAIKKKVTLPQLEMNVKVNSASYTGYYEIIREKIRHAAYQNYTQTETGEVYIAFVIDSDGTLKDVRYIEDKSSPSFYLKDTSLRSIKEAAPFPPFPRDLDYPQLSFNVIISFQIDQ